KVGQKVQLSDDDGVSASGGVRDSGATVEIEAITYNADGTCDLTATTAWNTINGATAGDFIFQEDDYQNVPYSIFSWIPTTDAAAATTFAGQDRSADIVSLAGLRHNVAGASTEEAIIDMLAKARFFGIKVSQVWLGSMRYAELLKNLHSKSIFSEGSMPAEPGISIDGLKVRGGKNGAAMVLEEPGMPDDYML